VVPIRDFPKVEMVLTYPRFNREGWMRRREFIAGLGSAAAWPVVARAQPPIPLIGFLQAGSASSTAHYTAAFRDAMHQLGYAEGRNARYEFRFADGALERLPQLAADLVSLNPSVIVSGPLPANIAVQKADPHRYGHRSRSSRLRGGQEFGSSRRQHNGRQQLCGGTCVQAA
jgi:hypothetical protein